MYDALVLFAKRPVPGGVKTRLIPPLSAGEAAEFHRACIADAWEKLGELEAGRRDARGRDPKGAIARHGGADDVAATGGTRRYFYCDQAWDGPPPAVAPEQFRLQRGGNLGERMLRCFEELHRQGARRVLIIGSDSPSLPVGYLAEGLEALSRADVVLGPADDGGYYAIGCRKTGHGMFDGVPWSSPETLERTEESLRNQQLTSLRLEPWFDVDTVADLRRLAVDPGLGGKVGLWVEAHRRLFV